MRRVNVVPALIVNEERDPKRISSILSLHFRIKKHFVRDARIEVRCEASILNIYRRSKLAEIFVKTHNNAENLATPRHNHEFGSLAVKTDPFWKLTFIINLALIIMSNNRRIILA